MQGSERFSLPIGKIVFSDKDEFGDVKRMLDRRLEPNDTYVHTESVSATRLGMEWTTEKPMQAGFYWVWANGNVHMAEVNEYSLPNGFFLLDQFCEFMPHYHFIGPLPEPEPPHAPN